jgi:RNA polymerase sigma-70 factor, ECF subfamily
MGPEASDTELARQIAAAGPGAADAEALLVGRYAPRVRLYGLKHLKSATEAEDLTQQVMLRVLEAIRAGRVDDPASLASFVFGTCKHVSWDMRRAAQRQRRIEREGERSYGNVNPPEHSERDVHRLFGCVMKLPEREAQILRMSFMEDRGAEDIARRLGLTEGNVRVIRCRALAKVASCMEASS